MSKWKGWR